MLTLWKRQQSTTTKRMFDLKRHNAGARALRERLAAALRSDGGGMSFRA